jgi:leader peptidase (prepilin peptidase)/N-methyltransferase
VTTSLLVAPGLRGAIGAALALLMLAIAAIDARRFIIPDELSAAAFALALVHAALCAPDAVLEAAAIAVLRGGLVALVFMAVRVGYRALREREGIGLGDVKLAGVAGAWLDWSTLPIAVEIAAVAALAIHLVRQHVLRRPVRPTNRLPFGLFLAPAIWLGWLWEALLLAPY